MDSFRAAQWIDPARAMASQAHNASRETRWNSMTDNSLTPSLLRQRREAAVAQLCEHFARDNIDANELERLIDETHRATSSGELEAILGKLPALRPTSPAVGPASTARTPTHSRSAQSIVVALMGGAERRGIWSPGESVYVTAVMGGAVLDFRQAELHQSVTEVYVVAIMGGVEIIVPPGVQVESDGIGIMGGFGQVGNARFPIDGTGPVLRVRGVAIMGGVEIRQQAVGDETDRHALRAKAREHRHLERGSRGDEKNNYEL